MIRFLNTKRIWQYKGDVNARYFTSRGRAFVPRMTALPAVNDMYFREYVEGNPNLPARVRQYVPLFNDLMNVSRYRPVTPVGTLLWFEQVRAMEKAARHTFTPKEALSRSAQFIQRELDELYAEKDYPQVDWPRVAAGCAAVGLVLVALVYLLGGRRDLVRRMTSHESRAAYLFASPWLLGLCLFTGGPIIVSFIYSFCSYDVLNPAEFVGLKNYRDLFLHDALFWKSLANTAYMVLGVPLSMVVGLAIALLLNTNVRGLKFYRTLFYLPAIVPMVASSILWLWVLNPNNGLINSLLRMVGVSSPPLWLHSPSWLLGSKAAIILMMVWAAGSGMIIWLAGLKGIPQHLYEAAEIDGAGPVRRFLNVTLPMLTPYIFFNLVMGIIITMQIFTQAYIMTLGGPDDSTMFYAYYLFNNAFSYFKMGYASAMAWIMLVIVCALTLLQLKLSEKWVHYDLD